MILKTTGKAVSQQAITGNYVGIPYSKLDCQGFVEQVLKDLGVRKPDGSPYNWRGSNSMWRNYIKWKGTIAECREQFGEIPEGAFLFLLKNDHGEEDRGYHDGLGNASHVGLYLGTDPKPCMDSQGNRGVDYCKLSVFTHVGLMSMIDYSVDALPEPADILTAVHIVRNPLSTDAEFLEALEKLTKHLKGV